MYTSQSYGKSLAIWNLTVLYLPPDQTQVNLSRLEPDSLYLFNDLYYNATDMWTERQTNTINTIRLLITLSRLVV